MTFYVKTYPDALRQLFVSCSSEEVTKAFDEALQILQKKIALPGYRKGKVPTDIILKSNPPELKNMISDILMKGAFEYIESQNTLLYGQPRFNPMSGLSRDKEFNFSLIYEIYPQISQDIDLSSLKLSYTPCEMDQKFVEETMCKQIQLLETINSSITEGDFVKVAIQNKDYTGDKKEASFDVSKLEILVGKKADEIVKISFNDLSGYLPEFLGKVSDPLEVKIIEISRPKEWSKVTDAEITERSPFKTKEEYYSQAKQQFEGMISQYNNSKKSEELSKAIYSQINIELPKSVWLNNLRDLTVKTAEKEILRDDISLTELSAHKDVLEKFSKLPLDSIEGLTFLIWLGYTAQKENITLDDSELEFHYFQYAQSQQLPMQDYKKHISSEEKSSIKDEALRQKTLTHLLEKITFKETGSIPLSEVIKQYGK